MQVGRSKYSEFLSGAGVMFDWVCVAGGGGVWSSFSPRVVGGACWLDLHAEDAPRESTGEGGRGGCFLATPKLCEGFGWHWYGIFGCRVCCVWLVGL